MESQSDILSDNHITYLNAAFHPFPGAGWLRVTRNEYRLGGIYTPCILTGYIRESMKVTHWIVLCFSQYCPMCSSSPVFREHYLIENQISASECQPGGSPRSLLFSAPQPLVFDTNNSHLYQGKNRTRAYLNTPHEIGGSWNGKDGRGKRGF